MAAWTTAQWEQSRISGLPSRDRKQGAYRRYSPDRMTDLILPTSATLSHLSAEAEAAILSLHDETGDLRRLGRLLVRSEAIASSRIEGIAPSPRNVALAELHHKEALVGVTQDAAHVADNLIAVQQAISTLTETARLTPADIETVHASLLPNEPRHHGLRTVQNWIGGSNYHPLDADFVPPAPDMVPALMEDLATYMRGALHAPIIQAALAHAQFETIHPFTDGNGRLGRALIHTVLHRRGIIRGTSLPISLVFATFSRQYVAALTAYRHGLPSTHPDAQASTEQWLMFFCESAILATEQARELSAQVAELRDVWREDVEEYRSSQGALRKLRKDSATSLILENLPGTPVLTLDMIAHTHGISRQAAHSAIEELSNAGVLQSKKMGPHKTVHIAGSVLDLVTWAERRLASTQFDTRLAGPHGGIPARPT